MRLSYLLNRNTDNPASGKNVMMLNSQMNDGNSPPLNVHANLRYSKKNVKSKPSPRLTNITAYDAVHAAK